MAKKFFLRCCLMVLASMIQMLPFNSCEASAMRHIIIDTDMGGDDAAALVLAAKSPNVKIEGVTVLAGNVDLEQAAKNALMTLEVAGVNIPVYKGADRSLVNREVELFSVYGEDGMGDVDLIHPKGKVQKKSAVDFILETVRKNPDQIEIILLGPATNVALAIQKDPATMKRVKRFWSMGTSGFGEGNATPVAEFNVFKDAEAYKVMLDSGVPVTVVGLDIMNSEVRLNAEILTAMKNSSPTQRFIALANEKYLNFCRDELHSSDALFCDPVTMAVALWDDFVLETATCHASCITEPNETYGQVLFYRKNHMYDTMVTFDSYPVEVVTKIKGAEFFPRYRAAI